MSDELDVDWNTVTWTELIEAIRKQKAQSELAASAGSAPETRSRCEMRPGIGLCDKCSKPKWPQEDMGYGIMLCLDCLDAERKAQNEKGQR